MVDLFSDTQTRPTAGMREAMARAEVGDEQSGSDPTTNALCARVAELLGKEDAVLMPSGTMCNLVSILVQTKPGDEIVVDATSHIFNTEAASAAAIGGVSTMALATADGVFSAGQVEAAIRAPVRTAPRSALVSVENTTAFSGGSVWPIETVRAVRDVAKRHGLKAHFDGARLLNAVAATGVSAADYVEGFDSAWIDLSKGLGCPVGGVLAGSKDFIIEAWRWKYRLGGAMRQSGVLAAAGLYALDHHIAQLATDNQNATTLDAGLRKIPGVAFEAGTQSNILRFSVEGLGVGAAEFAKACLERGVRFRATGAYEIRATTSLEVDAAGVARAIEVARDVAAALRQG
ncbi:threonine aldolase family protein [Chelatococcus sambhunathii]|uniref:Threonine aldolase family protein n=1 Tax=Chelatococcus sambhunathii TaxID=363953 RepID=A0ABU1DGP2_9HYPH|nr:threonine aldolase family protein [Chelatococcus sambhunathii]MDR4307221.1 threonine aldolase family protein [Chelatococcus sambhunathii]